ncbi:hypothetical protein CRG98_017221 [Punica granatum]|uniref:Protein kinase domain-containing protein n=1 Tax=Punica granatum TaxID=22663 RepID=A0A2I0K1H8_PUNGR|nr:hypothetical protein CRG98_017221 [Punica granatum]
MSTSLLLISAAFQLQFLLFFFPDPAFSRLPPDQISVMTALSHQIPTTPAALDLSDNDLSSIPPHFFSSCGSWLGLRLLNFSRNKLVGSLPAFAGHSLPQLEFLDLSHNSLDGTIGSQLDGLVSLRSLNLSSNSFGGSLPVPVGSSGAKFPALQDLKLSTNNFHGPIPPQIADYPSLVLIDLSFNSLNGTLPGTLGQLQDLQVLILSANDLSGPIPHTLSNLSKLSRFSANQNHFTGAVPSWLPRSLRSLDLSYNDLSGPIPSELLSPPSLSYVDLSFNRLEGQIPPNISPAMFRLRLGSNSLSGAIPSSAFLGLHSLTYLELDNNTFRGPIPIGLGHCRSLALLNLAKNRLFGPFPPELRNLSSLQVLKLQFNNLSGEIPGIIGSLTSLSQLNMSWNLLTGPIPSSISSLRNLTILNLQHNHLVGSIPDSIAHLDSLIELQLGSNRLNDPIPPMPPNLQIALNLSNNLFNGQIPSAVSQLKNLEVLDLSNNEFSGSIPESLTAMDALARLVLTNNRLSGIVPEFGPLVKLEIEGNNVTLRSHNRTTSSPKKRNSVALAIIIALASGILASILAAILVFSLWRRFCRVEDEHFQSGEDLPLPQVVRGTLLTTNRIHRSSIDFNRAMEAVTDPLKIIVKTRFSTYYKATMPSGMSYYVKKLNWSDKIFQLGNHDKFARELEGLGKLNNSNVMTPLAYVLSVDSAYLFYEYAQKGTLFDVFHGGSNELDWASRYSIAVGVAQGLAFLHDCSSGPILLLDLSSKSILLKSLKESQVGDIELCKVIDPSKSTGSLSTVAGSVGYIPPEYAYTMRMTTAGNVYSFGVVLVELVTGKPAVSEGTELAKWVLAKSSQWDRILDISVSRTSSAVRSQMLNVLKIALSCVSPSPEARPKMKSVLRMLLNAR